MTDYERIYTLYQKVKHRAPVIALQAQMEAEARAEHLRLFPRRRKFNWLSLPADYCDSLKAKFLAQLQAAWRLQKRQLARLDVILNQLAATADLSPLSEECALRSSDGSAYHTQGFGANHYARGKLVPAMVFLQQAGFSAHIVEGPSDIYPGPDRWGITYSGYQLIANAAAWQLDALERIHTQRDWVAALEAVQINPRVYNPFLPYGALSYEQRPA